MCTPERNVIFWVFNPGFAPFYLESERRAPNLPHHLEKPGRFGPNRAVTGRAGPGRPIAQTGPGRARAEKSQTGPGRADPRRLRAGPGPGRKIPARALVNRIFLDTENFLILVNIAFLWVFVYCL
jgi:hypothetical protein